MRGTAVSMELRDKRLKRCMHVNKSVVRLFGKPRLSEYAGTLVSLGELSLG